MSKKLIAGIIVIIVLSVLITIAAVNYMGFRDAAYDAISGTILMPIHDYIVSAWVAIGGLGFTYIAATSFGLMILGIVFGYAFSHWVKPHIPFVNKTIPTSNITLRGGPEPELPQTIEKTPTVKEETPS